MQPHSPQVSWYSDAMLAHFIPESSSHDALSEYIHQLLGSTADWMSPSDSMPLAAVPAYTAPSGMRTGGAAAGRTSGATAPRPPRASGGGSPAPPPREPPMSPAVGVLHRLRRSHTFAGKAGPAELTPSDWTPPGAGLQQQRPLKRRSVDDLSAPDSEPEPTVPHSGVASAAHALQPRGGAQLRRSSSLPGPPAGGQAATHHEGSAMQPAVGGIDPCYYSGARTPLWAAKRQAGAPPLLDARGVPTWRMPPEPPPAAQATSPYVGVSRAPWSTRWDAHAVTATGESVYCGSFDSEERAARAHDVAQLKLMGTAAGSGFCNFAVSEYQGIQELADMPLPDFLAALCASSVDPLERRYSKYRGVYRDRNAVKGGPERWESRLEEAPDGVNAASSGGDGASTGGMGSIM